MGLKLSNLWKNASNTKKLVGVGGAIAVGGVLLYKYSGTLSNKFNYLMTNNSRIKMEYMVKNILHGDEIASELMFDWFDKMEELTYKHVNLEFDDLNFYSFLERNKNNKYIKKNIAELYLLHKMKHHEKSYAKQNKEAINLLNESADSGNDEAMFTLGALYESGKIVEQNYKTALEYYLKAIQFNNCNAFNNLGSMYKNGRGVEQNEDSAKNYYIHAISNGNTRALFNLRMIYEKDDGKYKEEISKIDNTIKKIKNNKRENLSLKNKVYNNIQARISNDMEYIM